MRLYYIDESEGPRYYVRSALGVDAERWNDPWPAASTTGGSSCKNATPSPPTGSFMPATCWPDGTSWPVATGPTTGSPPSSGAEVFTGGLRVVEDAARTIGGVEVVNVCLRKPDVKGYERVSLDRLLNRINTSVASANRHAFLIFDEGREEMIARLYRRLRSRNPVPSRYEATVGGRRADEGHSHREGHRRPRLPKLPLRPPATDGRPHRPRPPQAGGGAVAQGQASGHRKGLRDTRPRPQPQGVEARPPGRRQEMTQRVPAFWTRPASAQSIDFTATCAN